MALASRITDSELEIMKVLWAAGCALPLSEIRKRLEDSSGWESSTIKTLLRRLCQKGVVATEKKGVFCYHPQVDEREYNEYATQALIDRLYDGSAKNLVASLLGEKKLDDADLEELRIMFEAGDNGE